MKSGILYIVIFVLGLGIGFVAGYGTHIFQALSQPVSSSVVTGATQTAQADASSTEQTSSTSPAATQKPITVKTSSLTPAQKALLASFGINADTVTITPQMISCAYGTLGEARVNAIVAGAKPTAMEMVKVAPCIK